MYDDITNIYKLWNTHPFLHKSFELFTNFNVPVEKRRSNGNYDYVCKVITSKLHIDKETYNDFCKKLLKNNKIFCKNPTKCVLTPEYCYDLNNWIYITMKKEKIENIVVQKIYEGIKHFATGIPGKSLCSYYSYDADYREPSKIIFFYMFANNIPEMKKILNDDNNPLTCYCKKFVKNMVEIYKRMSKEYCTNGKDKLKKNEKTCSVLNNFSTYYTGYLCNEKSVKNILPLLTSEEHIESIECETNGSIIPSQITSESSNLGSDDHSEPFQDLSDEEIQAIENFDPFTLKVSIKKILPTFLATVAGISSLFFLFYKFTPIRHLLRSKKKVETIKNMYDEYDYEELLYSTAGNTNMNLYNRRYDIAYENI